VLAYEMLSGRIAYTAKNPAALVAEMRNSPPPPLRTLRAAVSDEFELFIHTLMSLDRRQRYGSATEALRVLTDPRFETSSPDDEPTAITAAPPEPPEPPPADPAPPASDEVDSSQRVQIFAWNSRRP
jgi:serine/threonine protein kinase